MLRCVRCNEGVGCDRVAVEVATDAEVGGLCAACERETFGVVLRDRTWQRPDGCVLCPRDGHFALPVIDVLIERPEAPDTREYVAADGPVLCDRHFHELVEVPLPVSELVRSDSQATT